MPELDAREKKNGVGFWCKGTRIVKFSNSIPDRIILPTLKLFPEKKDELHGEHYAVKNIVFVHINNYEKILSFIKKEVKRIVRIHGDLVKQEKKVANVKEKVSKVKETMKKHEEKAKKKVA